MITNPKLAIIDYTTKHTKGYNKKASKANFGMCIMPADTSHQNTNSTLVSDYLIKLGYVSLCQGRLKLSIVFQLHYDIATSYQLTFVIKLRKGWPV